MDFWSLLAWFFWSFVFISYLMVIFSIIGDIFRDPGLGGGVKALWVIFLVFVPFLAALVYLIARGKGMSARATAQAREMRQAQDDYIRETAGASSPADDIAKAKALLDSGAIAPSEYDALKTRALAT